MKIIRNLLFSLLFVLLFTACNASCNASEAEGDMPTQQVDTPKPTLTDTVVVPVIRIEGVQSQTVSETPDLSATPTVTAQLTNGDTPTPSPTYIVVPIVDTNELALRTGPGIYYELITLYPEGTELILLGTEPLRRWFYVRVVEDGNEGWVFGEYLNLDPRLLEFIPVVDATPTPKPIDLNPDLTATQACKWLEDRGTPCP